MFVKPIIRYTKAMKHPDKLYTNGFPDLLALLIKESRLRQHVIASRSHIGGLWLSQVKNNRGFLDQRTAEHVAEQIGIPQEHRTAFGMLAFGLSINDIPDSASRNYFQNLSLRLNRG